MSGNNINFDGKIIKKSNFYKNKKIFNKSVLILIIYQSHIIITYNSFKYFIGYNDNNVIKALYLELSQMTGYINKFNERKNKNKNKNKNRITMS